VRGRCDEEVTLTSSMTLSVLALGVERPVRQWRAFSSQASEWVRVGFYARCSASLFFCNWRVGLSGFDPTQVFLLFFRESLFSLCVGSSRDARPPRQSSLLLPTSRHAQGPFLTLPPFPEDRNKSLAHTSELCSRGFPPVGPGGRSLVRERFISFSVPSHRRASLNSPATFPAKRLSPFFSFFFNRKGSPPPTHGFFKV